MSIRQILIQREKILRILYRKLVNVDVETLPQSFIEFYKPVDYKTLIKPLIFEDYNKGKSLTQIALKYDIKKSTVRSIILYTKPEQ